MSKIYSKGFQEYWTGVMRSTTVWRAPIKSIAFNAYKAGIAQAQREQEEKPKRLAYCDYCTQWVDGPIACCDKYDGSVHYKTGELEGGFVGDHLRSNE